MHSCGLFPQLPGDVEQRIVSCLPRNDVACTVRLLNKAAAAFYSGPDHITVRLSQPVSHCAFLHKWAPASPEWRLLSLSQRIKLVCLVAATGDLANLEVAINACGISFTRGTSRSGEVGAAAASVGKLHVCQWLQQQGFSLREAFASAAKAGHQHVCKGILESGYQPEDGDVRLAADSGHLELVQALTCQRDLRGDLRGEALVRERTETAYYVALAAAHGRDLATLQRLYDEWMNQVQAELRQQEHRDQGGDGEGGGDADGAQGQAADEAEVGKRRYEAILAAATGSPTPDWQAKVQWLEAQGCPRTEKACSAAATTCGGPEAAVERLTWLRQRGYPVTDSTVMITIWKGHNATVQFLMGPEVGIRLEGSMLGTVATVGNFLSDAGLLAVLQTLWQHQQEALAYEFRLIMPCAARKGHMAVVAWLVETLGVTETDEWQLLDDAAASGNMELMSWLRERGWRRVDFMTFVSAARGGCEAMVEQLVEQGCPMSGFPQGGGYISAAYNGDVAMLRCLRRLGCPWGGCSAFTASVAAGTPLLVLRWMVGEGCPVHWAAALQAAEEVAAKEANRRPEGWGRVVEWLREEANVEARDIAGVGSSSSGIRRKLSRCTIK